jgi:transcription elongation factor GreB
MARRITSEGYTKITSEISFLWDEERPRIVEEVYEAAQLGDRSENAAYIYGKKRLREIDSRLNYLRRQIENIQVIDITQQRQQSSIDFGALVTILNVSEEAPEDVPPVTYRIVDQMEADPDNNRLSIQSPLGKALLRKKVGEDAELNLPRGTVTYEILEIHYGPAPETSNENETE